MTIKTHDSSEKTISSNNIFIWWGYILHRLVKEYPPLTVSLCKLFWVNVATTSAFVVGGLLLSLLIVAMITDWIQVLVATLIVVVSCSLVALVGYVVISLDESKDGDTAYTIKEYLKARKENFCPIYRVR